MPLATVWTPQRDTQLRRLRAEGESWDAIARVLGISRNTVLERGRRIGARLPPTTLLRDVAAARAAQEARRAPLPAGHALTWGAITAPTSLAGTRYPEWAIDRPALDLPASVLQAVASPAGAQ